MYVFIAGLTTCAMVLWGWHKGLLHLVLRLSALLLAYVFTWQVTPAFAAYITERGWLSGVLVWPAAGLALFFVGSMVLSLLARGVLHIAPAHWQSEGKLAGGVIGAALGCGLGLLLVWTTGALQDAWHIRTANENQQDENQQDKSTPAPISALPASVLSYADQVVRHWSGDVIATMAQRTLGDSPAATVATQWVRDPLSMSEGLQHLANKPALRQLFQDPASYDVLVKGSSADIQRLPAFQALTDDPQVMQLLSVAGLPGEALPQQSQALAGMLSRYAGNFEKMRTTPEFQALVQNPDLRQKLQQGNLLVLLTDDKIRQLASMLTQDNTTLGKIDQPATAAHSPPIAPAQPITPAQPMQEKNLYRWKDERGRVHITEDQPPEGIKADVIQL